MASLRGFAQCIGLGDDFSVAHHIREVVSGSVVVAKQQPVPIDMTSR